jgi:putative oxidoreductase
VLRSLTRTTDSLIPTIARIALGLVILPHGLQKAFGLFGGPGFENAVAFMGTLGIPAALAALVIAIEVVGGAALLVGGLSRAAAAGVAAVLLGAVIVVHRGQFFMNWTGTAPGEGYEYHILAITLAAIVVVAGSGRWSLDRILATSRS